jgi:hypothetical protein
MTEGSQTIIADSIVEMAAIVYELVQHGMTFKVIKTSGYWKIILLGGF